eukprot:gene7661-9425_t
MMYAAIMRDQRFQIPIKRGEFIKLSQQEFESWPFIKFGIYRVVIQGNNKAFRFNPRGYYTHYDLQLAKTLGLMIKLIEDGNPNFLSYDGPTKINGDTLFKSYIDYVLDLIKKGVPRSKELYTTFWGML